MSWNGDSLISQGNKFTLSDATKNRYTGLLQVIEKVSFLSKLTVTRDLNIERGFAKWARFETAMHPEILLWRAHDFSFDDLVDKRCGFAFVFRIVSHFRRDVQTIA